MQDKSFNEIVNSNHLERLENFKLEYQKARRNENESEYNVFRLEENLYLYITEHFLEHWQKKIELCQNFRKKYKDLWEIAFKYKYMQADELNKYKSIERERLKYFYSEKLGAYFALKIFAECNFTRENILKKRNPDKFAFTLFRMGYKGAGPNKYENWQFVEIIEDIETLLTKQKRKRIDKKKLFYTKDNKFILDSEEFLNGSESLKYCLLQICNGEKLDSKNSTISSNVSRINSRAKYIIGTNLIKNVKESGFWLEDYIIFSDKTK